MLMDRPCPWLALCCLLPAAVLQAQSTKAELFGTLFDPSHLVLSGATVEVVNTLTNASVSMSTDASGAFHFTALPAATYQLRVAKAGFNTLRRDGLVLRTGDRIHLDLLLSVGDVSQSVDVTAGTPLLQTNRGTTSFVLEQKQAVTLPLDGRNFVP